VETATSCNNSPAFSAKLDCLRQAAKAWLAQHQVCQFAPYGECATVRNTKGFTKTYAEFSTHIKDGNIGKLKKSKYELNQA
jgi:hypothetical protein